MVPAIYGLCTLTALLAAALLLRAYRRNGYHLLLWSGLCFVGLALNNFLLIMDRLILTDTDLSTVRILPALVGVMTLLYGLIMEGE